jgi:PTH1 family peptidyl-tRNA hydrolase
MILIVGLGNPGERYEKTRHNLGFMVVGELARKLLPVDETNWQESKRFNSLVIIHQSLIILSKPQTFMNASGLAVARLANYYHIEPAEIWVVHDDVDLPLGKIKIRIGGAAAGHHGVESIIKELKSNRFVRFRLGIGHPGRGADANVEEYVLREFDINERGEVAKMVKKAVKALIVASEKGVLKAMNQFN